MKSANIVTALVCGAVLSGCSSTKNPFSGKTFVPFDVASAQSVSVDATQRFLLVKRVPNGDPTDVLVCAEPSPDAAIAGAAQAAASGILPSGAQAGVSGAFSESLASIGLRTPAIQLVRDMFFRACEGLMNGVHDADELNRMALKIDRTIITLAAIDGLSNAPVAPAVAIGQVGGAKASTESTLQAASTTGKGSTEAGTTNLVVQLQANPAKANLDQAAAAIKEIVTLYITNDTISDDIVLAEMSKTRR